MSWLRLFAHQVRYDQLLFWRNPASVFFSIALPLIFLFMLAAVFGNEPASEASYGLSSEEYLVPAIITLGIVSATFVNIAISVTFDRETGVLKRLRGTPLPTSVFVTARTASAVVNAALIAIAIMLAGKFAYGVEITGTRIAGVATAIAIGSVALCALGFALTIAIPNQAAAPAITNVIVLPLYFISGVFGMASDLPSALREIGEVFPVSHLASSLLQSFDPDASGFPIQLSDLLNVVIWGAAGLLIASLKFRWEPREQR